MIRPPKRLIALSYRRSASRASGVPDADPGRFTRRQGLPQPQTALVWFTRLDKASWLSTRSE